MRLSEICRRDVVHCTPRTSVREIAKMMREHHVGDVIVVEARDTALVPVGIVTDRDMVLEVLAQDVEPDAVTAKDVMGPTLVTASDDEAVYDAIWHMRGKGVRRLPVVNEQGFLVGVLTADDLTAFLAEELKEIARIAPAQRIAEKMVLATP